MQSASENDEAVMQGRAVARGWRALALVVFGAGVLGAIYVFAGLYVMGRAFSRFEISASRGSECDGCDAAPRGSAVRQAGRVVGVIEQVAAPRAGRPLPMFLAKVSGRGSVFAIDSAQSGQLVARLDLDPTSAVWTIELVARDSVRGAPVGRLVAGAGPPALPVWGDSAA